VTNLRSQRKQQSSRVSMRMHILVHTQQCAPRAYKVAQQYNSAMPFSRSRAFSQTLQKHGITSPLLCHHTTHMYIPTRTRSSRSHLVAHCAAQGHAQLPCHALRSADGSNTPRLRHHNGPRPLRKVLAAKASLQQELRHLGGLTAASLTTQHLHAWWDYTSPGFGLLESRAPRGGTSGRNIHAFTSKLQQQPKTVAAAAHAQQCKSHNALGLTTTPCLSNALHYVS
jgi:hypothetical protein